MKSIQFELSVYLYYSKRKESIENKEIIDKTLPFT